jgi:hypothetical protein
MRVGHLARHSAIAKAFNSISMVLPFCPPIFDRDFSGRRVSPLHLPLFWPQSFILCVIARHRNIVDKPPVTNITTRTLATDAIYKTRERLSSAGVDNDRDDRSVRASAFLSSTSIATSSPPSNPTNRNSAMETYSARRMLAVRRYIDLSCC